MAEMPVADDPTSGTSHQAGQQTPPTFGESMADQSSKSVEMGNEQFQRFFEDLIATRAGIDAAAQVGRVESGSRSVDRVGRRPRNKV
ncbi:hypothetical protein VCV18_009996 [Metarhizium anisopliae]